jgi:hypothetical protein
MVERIGAPAPAIEQARPGPALIRGRVRAKKSLLSPVTHRSCVAYAVGLVLGDRAVRAERACADFIVDDGSGQAHVVAQDAVVLLSTEAGSQRVAERQAVARVDAGGGAAVDAVASPSRATLVERVLLAGEEVVVWGFALCSLTASGVTRHLALQSSALGPVVVTNRDPGDLLAESRLGLWLALGMAAAAVASTATALAG